MEENQKEIMVESENVKTKKPPKAGKGGKKGKNGKERNRPVWFLSGMIFSVTMLSMVAWRFAGSSDKEKKAVVTEELQLQKNEIDRVKDVELKAEKETRDKYLVNEADPMGEKSAGGGKSMTDEFIGDILEDEKKTVEEKSDLLNLSSGSSGISQDISLMEQMGQMNTGIESLTNESRPSNSSPRYGYSRRYEREESDQKSMFAYSRSYTKAQWFEGEGQRVRPGDDPDRNPNMMRPAGEPAFPTVIYNKINPVKVFEGNWLDGVLLNRLTADVEECPVIVSVSKDFFDDDGVFVIIPSGTRVIGKSKINTSQGASRLFIWFERMILPNGVSVRFPEGGRSLALDPQGAAGLVSKINRHFFLRFGNAIMFGLLEGLAGLTQRRSNYDDNKAIFVERSGQSLSQINSQMLQERTNILPTITVNQGHRVKVYLSSDLVISPYDHIHNRGYAK